MFEITTVGREDGMNVRTVAAVDMGMICTVSVYRPTSGFATDFDRLTSALKGGAST